MCSNIGGIEIDEEIQQDGRLLRKKVKGATAEAYSYVTASALTRAAEIVARALRGAREL